MPYPPLPKLLRSTLMNPAISLSKSQAQRVHACRRFRQRLGIELTNELHDEVVGMIRQNDPRARFVKRQSLRLSFWEIEFARSRCCVVYDRKRGNIVTVLPDPCRPLSFLGDFWPTNFGMKV